MKTFLKIAIVVILIAVIAVVGLIALGISQVNGLVKTTIERGGTYATQTSTTVDTVKVGLTDGTFAMSGLQIANPAGFSSQHFLKLNGTNVTLQPESILSQTIAIPTVKFQGIDVILDKGGNPSNYNTILNSLKRFESSDTKAAPENDNAKKVAIDSLILQDINIRVANVPGVSLLTGDIAINIPEIELQNLGKDEPMTAAQVVNLVIKTVLTAAVESGSGILPADLLGELGNGLTNLSSLSDMGITAIGNAGQIVGEQLNTVVNDALGQAGQAVEDLTTGAQDAVDKVTKDLPNEIGNAVDDATKDATDQADKAINDAKEKVEEEVEKGLKNIFGNKKKEDD